MSSWPSWNFLTALTGSGETPRTVDAGRGVVGQVVAHAARLRGAPGRVGLGIEVEDDLAAAEVAEAHGVAVLVGKLEVGGRLAGLDHAPGGYRAQLVGRDVATWNVRGPRCTTSSASTATTEVICSRSARRRRLRLEYVARSTPPKRLCSRAMPSRSGRPRRSSSASNAAERAPAFGALFEDAVAPARHGPRGRTATHALASRPRLPYEPPSRSAGPRGTPRCCARAYSSMEANSGASSPSRARTSASHDARCAPVAVADRMDRYRRAGRAIAARTATCTSEIRRVRATGLDLAGARECVELESRALERPRRGPVPLALTSAAARGGGP